MLIFSKRNFEIAFNTISEEKTLKTVPIYWS